MQYIKISLLSILIFLFGISTIIFMNVDNSQNYQKIFINPENSLSAINNNSDSEFESYNDEGPIPGSLSPMGIFVDFGDDFLSEDKTIGGKVTVNASWVRKQDEYGKFWGDGGLVIKLFDGETDTGLFENNIYIEFGYDTDELSFTQEGEYAEATNSWTFEDGDMVRFSATISGGENKIVDKFQKDSSGEWINEGDFGFDSELFINNTFLFELNHKYRFEIFIYSGQSPTYLDTIQKIEFITPATPATPATPNTWLDPVNFVLYVIILAEIIAPTSFLIILWINLRKN